MTWNRRETLRALGITSASTWLWALGCGAPARPPPRAPRQISSDVRTWLRDAITRLAAVYPSVHALAVTRRRTTAAIDVLGTGIARARRDGVVLTVRTRDGSWREHVTADLSQQGVLAAVQILVGANGTRAPIEFPAPPPHPAELAPILDDTLRKRVAAIMHNDQIGASRLVYAAAMIDIDDVTVWSVAPGHDREQTLRRVRKRATRAAWNGTRPVVSEVERGWVGNLDDQDLGVEDVTGASRNALQMMTPDTLTDGEANVVLEPSVTASVIDAAVRGLFTSTAARRPEVTKRLALGANVSAQALTLVDDPTTPAAYGGFAFDDEGTPAAAITLLDAGRVAGRLGRGLRAGHVGQLEPQPTHLRLEPGTQPVKQLFDSGWILEGKLSAVFDPSSDHVVIGVARARELRGGSDTGRIYADVELVGDLTTLLANVSGVASVSGTTIIRDERAGEPQWRSIAAPWVRTRGFVRARRRLS